jgi:hypothetical protein
MPTIFYKTKKKICEEEEEKSPVLRFNVMRLNLSYNKKIKKYFYTCVDLKVRRVIEKAINILVALHNDVNYIKSEK